jgi:hypothetical protein
MEAKGAGGKKAVEDDFDDDFWIIKNLITQL